MKLLIIKNNNCMASNIYLLNFYTYICYLQKQRITKIIKNLADKKSINYILGGAK